VPLLPVRGCPSHLHQFSWPAAASQPGVRVPFGDPSLDRTNSVACRPRNSNVQTAFLGLYTHDRFVARCGIMKSQTDSNQCDPPRFGTSARKQTRNYSRGSSLSPVLARHREKAVFFSVEVIDARRRSQSACGRSLHARSMWDKGRKG
jgi:hypothetical protein